MEIGLNLFIAMKDMMSGDDMTGRVPNGMTGEHGQTSRRARGARGDRFTDLIGQSPKIPRKSAGDDVPKVWYWPQSATHGARVSSVPRMRKYLDEVKPRRERQAETMQADCREDRP